MNAEGATRLAHTKPSTMTEIVDLLEKKSA